MNHKKYSFGSKRFYKASNTFVYVFKTKAIKKLYMLPEKLNIFIN